MADVAVPKKTKKAPKTPAAAPATGTLLHALADVPAPAVPAPAAPSTPVAIAASEDEEPQPLFTPAPRAAPKRAPKSKSAPKAKAAPKPKAASKAAPKAAPKAAAKAKPDSDSEADEDDEEDDDVREGAEENADPDTKAEKLRLLALLAEWATRPPVETGGSARRRLRVRKLRVVNTLECIQDEADRVAQILGETIDDEDEDIVSESEASADVQATEEAEAARMLAELEGWWAARKIKQPATPITLASGFDVIEAAHGKAMHTLKIDTSVPAVQAEADELFRNAEQARVRKACAQAMVTRLQAWWAAKLIKTPKSRQVSLASCYADIESAFIDACEKQEVNAEAEIEAFTAAATAAILPPEIIAGRSLRNRKAIAKPVDAYRSRFGAETEEQLDRKEQRASMLSQLRAWKKEGYYTDSTDSGFTPLSTLTMRGMPYEAVVAEYEHVCAAIEAEDSDDSSSDESGSDDDTDSGSDSEEEFVAAGDDDEDGSGSGSDSGSDSDNSDNSDSDFGSEESSDEDVGTKRRRPAAAPVATSPKKRARTLAVPDSSDGE